MNIELAKKALDLMKTPSQSEKLRKGLGLRKFKYVYIQKVIDSPIAMFVITIDSRYPGLFIPFDKIKKLKFCKIMKAKLASDIIVGKKLKMTPPIELDTFTGKIPPNAFIIQRDMAGEHYLNKNMYESVEQIGVFHYNEIF